MIVAELAGGLGNQLFEYALGRHLSLLNGLPLKVDAETRFRGDFFQRSYALGPFNTSETVASAADRRRFERSWRHYRLERLAMRLKSALPPLGRLVGGVGRRIIVESVRFRFEPWILEPCPCSTILSGYWQNPRYFAAIRETLLGDITLRDGLSAPAAALADDIGRAASLGIHVRQAIPTSGGRFSEAALRYHGLLPREYYERAIATVAARHPGLTAFVFADDPDWARANIAFAGQTVFVEGNPDYDDLVLMSRCDHQIIANSSFSWWAAWLNRNPGKTVIAPRAYLRDPSVDTGGLYPEEWVVI